VILLVSNFTKKAGKQTDFTMIQPALETAISYLISFSNTEQQTTRSVRSCCLVEEKTQ